MNEAETAAVKQRQDKVVELATELERQARSLRMLGQFTHAGDVNLPRAIDRANQLLDEIDSLVV